MFYNTERGRMLLIVRKETGNDRKGRELVTL
jgi:hypothetical protein